jgi:hypothetical protein
MEKLYRVASYNGCAIGKSGGLTTFELAKAGTRFIIDNMPTTLGASHGVIGNLIRLMNWFIKTFFRFADSLSWEKINQDFAIDQGYGTSVSSKEEFFAAFDKILSESGPKKLNTQVLKCSERLPEIIKAMKAEAENDASLRERRIYKLEPARAVHIL